MVSVKTCPHPRITFIAEWGYRLDLGSYASMLASATKDEIQSFRAKMLQSDYHKHGVGIDFKSWSETLDIQGQAQKIRLQLLSITNERASDTCKSWLQTVRISLDALKVAKTSAGSGMEKELLVSLVAKYADAISTGNVRSENLEIAAKVAAGKLDGDVVISTLLSRYLAFEDRRAQGCLKRSCRSMDSAAATEFLLTIGRWTLAYLGLFLYFRKPTNPCSISGQWGFCMILQKVAICCNMLQYILAYFGNIFLSCFILNQVTSYWSWCQGKETKSLLRRFGVNPRTLKVGNLFQNQDHLPRFFCACKDLLGGLMTKIYEYLHIITYNYI